MYSFIAFWIAVRADWPAKEQKIIIMTTCNKQNSRNINETFHNPCFSGVLLCCCSYFARFAVTYWGYRPARMALSHLSTATANCAPPRSAERMGRWGWRSLRVWLAAPGSGQCRRRRGERKNLDLETKRYNTHATMHEFESYLGSYRFEQTLLSIE